MPHILSCTDGSSYAPSLYQHTAWAAHRLSARVEVLHVLDHHRERTPHIDLSGTIGIDANALLMEELINLEESQGRVQRAKGTAILENARLQLAEHGLNDVILTQRHGSLVETLEELEPACDLVILGERGTRAETAKAHLGSNLERVVRTAVRPVLVVERIYQPIERFLIAYDGGPSVNKAIDFVCTSPLLKNLDCHLVRAGQIDDQAKWYLEEAAMRLRENGYTVQTHALPLAPEVAIAEIIQRENVHLVVMGAYGHSPIRSLILGSTTTTVIRTSPVPVLMFR